MATRLRIDASGGFVGFLNDPAAIFKLTATGIRYPHVARRPIKQLYPQTIFQGGDCARQGRRRHAEPPCTCGKAFFLGNRYKDGH
jgi:hypothetical protein